MPSLQVSTREDQRRILDWLSTHFQIPCHVRHKTQGRSKAYVRRKRIVLSDMSQLGKLYVCVHEFAHILAEHAHSSQGHKHGKFFRTALCDILSALEMPVTTYPWAQEYVALYNWARRTQRCRSLAASGTKVVVRKYAIVPKSQKVLKEQH